MRWVGKRLCHVEAQVFDDAFAAAQGTPSRLR